MTLNNYLTLFFMFTGLTSVCQHSVCESSGNNNDLTDINTIGRCAIENFKQSKNREFVKVSTRNRYIRKKSTATIVKLREDLKALSNKAAVGKENRTQETLSKTQKDNLIKEFVRFDHVNTSPVFVTCAGLSTGVDEGCVKETIVNNVLDNLIYPFDAAAEGIEGTVWVRFIIDKDGYVKNITSKGPSNGDLLKKEAERLVSLLPKFIPGKHNNQYVNVEYFMPIDFQLDQ